MENTEPGPELLRSWIERSATKNPDKAYIFSVDDRRIISFAELQRLSRQIAAFLATHGVGSNDRVALLANNSIEHLACYIGVMAYGATICTIHVEMNRQHFTHILPALKPRLIVYEPGLELDHILASTSVPCLPLGTWDGAASGSFYASVASCEPTEPAFPTTRPGDDACILFTSGTSDRPKGVALTFRELLSNVEPTADGFGMTESDRIYDFRSYNWCSAQVLSALAPLARGASLIMARRFTRSKFFHHIKEYEVTIAAGNPTTVNMLLNSVEPLPAEAQKSIRFVISSSAPLLVEDWRRFEQRFGIPIVQGYGCSEIGWIAAHPGEHRQFGTVGRPLPYHKLAIVDDDGRKLPVGETGHVELGGFAGNDYRYLAEDGTIKVTSQARFRTGDIGFFDDGGFLHLTGRAKDLIIRGGVNISPLEIDGILMRCPEVIEVATVGVPDRTYGEEVVSYVVLRPDANIGADDLLHYCNTLLPAFKSPKRIVLRKDLPKTERGKLDRKALTQLWVSDHRDVQV
jgi:acyl-coenzyme A synthetase/AMP-(fatty) acid ligase